MPTHVAVFDTAFHHTLPPPAYAYALPYKYLTEKGIRRYGFHGISHRYVSWRFAQIHGKTRADYRMITCHLGNGCSVCAIDRGKSIELPWGSRRSKGWSWDRAAAMWMPGAILYLITQEKLQPADVANILNRESGLKGLSGVSNDMRDVLKEGRAAGDIQARLAVDTFCYRVQEVYRGISGGHERRRRADFYRRDR